MNMGMVAWSPAFIAFLTTEIAGLRNLALADRTRGSRLVWLADSPTALACAHGVALSLSLPHPGGWAPPSWASPAIGLCGLGVLASALIAMLRSRRPHGYMLGTGGVCLLWSLGAPTAALATAAVLMLLAQGYEYELWRRLDGYSIWGRGPASIDPSGQKHLFAAMYYSACVAIAYLLMSGREGLWGDWTLVAVGLAVPVLIVWYTDFIPIWPFGADLPGISWLHRRLVASTMREAPRGPDNAH